MVVKERVVEYKGKKLKIQYDPNEMFTLDLVTKTRSYIRKKGLEYAKFPSFYYQKSWGGKRKKKRKESNTDMSFIISNQIAFLLPSP